MNKPFPSIFNTVRAGASGRTALAIASLALPMIVATATVQADTVFSADFGTVNDMKTSNAVLPTTLASILNAGTQTGSWSGYHENFTQTNAVGTIANAGATDGGFEFRLTSGNGQGAGLLGTIQADFTETLDFSTDAATLSWDWYRVDNSTDVRGELFAYDSNGNLVYGLQMRNNFYFETVDGVTFTTTGIVCDTTSTGFGDGNFNPSGLQSVTLKFSPSGVLINGSVASGLSLSYDEIAYLTCGIRADTGLKFGIIWDNISARGAAVFGPDAFPAIASTELVSNGDFLQVTPDTGSGVNGAWNVTGSNGDYPNTDGQYATVDDWEFYYDDPNNLIAETSGGQLEGTDKLGTIINSDIGWVGMNSSFGYLNGMTQVNILNGANIESGATYEFVVDVRHNSGKIHTLNTFTAALTVGTNVTTTGTAVAGSLLSVNPTDSLPTAADVAPQAGMISGADLLAAQGAGQVNVIFQSLNTVTITGWPNAVVDANDSTEVSQIHIESVSLSPVINTGDVNMDGLIDQDDVDFANDHLDGSIDGGDTSAARVAVLMAAPFNYTAAGALAALNLSEFDINDDDVFDAADVAAIEALLVVADVVIEGSGFNGANFEVQLSGLVNGTTYYLMRDSDLSDGAQFTTEADNVTAASDTATLIDDAAPANQAFYQVTDVAPAP